MNLSIVCYKRKIFVAPVHDDEGLITQTQLVARVMFYDLTRMVIRVLLSCI